MAPKKKIIDKPPKATVKGPQKPMKPPKKIKMKIGCSVALARLRAEAIPISPKQKYVNKTTKNQSVDDSVIPQKQLHSPVTKMRLMTTKKHNVDDPVTPQKQLYSHVTRKYAKKTTETCSVDDSVTQQKQLHTSTPVTIKYDNKTTGVHSVDDSERVQEQKKKRPGPKSMTLLYVIKKPTMPVTTASNKPSRKNQQELVKSANISQEIGPDNSSDIYSNEGLADSDGCENDAATPNKRPRKRAKGSTKGYQYSTKNVAPMLENVLENPSPPKPNNRRNSVISNKSNLTWTKDISTESSISSDTTTSVTMTYNDSVNLNKKTEQLQNPGQLKITNDNLKQMYLSEKSTNESCSPDSESNLPSSPPSNLELGGTSTISEHNLSTSSLTPQSPLSDSKTDRIRRSFENMNKPIENFQADMKTLLGWSTTQQDKYLRSDSASGLIPVVDHIIHKFENFKRDLETMYRKTNNSEKLIECHRTADFTVQNESEIRSFEGSRSRRSSYEDNRSDTSSPKSNLTEESIKEGEIISNTDDKEQEPGTKPKEISRASSFSRAMNKPVLEW